MKTKIQPKKSKNPRSHHVRNLGIVFRAHRGLLKEIERVVIKDLELPLELVDILIDLYGARYLGWSDPTANKEGFVTVRALRDGLVHSGALLSLRLKRLGGMIEVKKIPRTGPGSEHRHGLRSSRSWVRIQEPGTKVASLVWERYQRLAERLLGDVHPQDLETHFRVNEIIRRRCEGIEEEFEDEEEQDGEEVDNDDG